MKTTNECNECLNDKKKMKLIQMYDHYTKRGSSHGQEKVISIAKAYMKKQKSFKGEKPKKGELTWCNALNWIKYKGRLLYLTTKDLNHKEVIAEKIKAVKDFELTTGPGPYGYWDQLTGYQIIRKVYNLKDDDGTNCGCDDFSNKNNFPKEIWKALISGQFRGISFNNPNLLNKEGLKKYQKVKQDAYEAYCRLRQPIREEWFDMLISAKAVYNKGIDRVYEEHMKRIKNVPKIAKSKKDLKKRKDSLTRYDKEVLILDKQRDTTTDPGDRMYEHISDAALTNYHETTITGFWDIFAEKKYRIKSCKK